MSNSIQEMITSMKIRSHFIMSHSRQPKGFANFIFKLHSVLSGCVWVSAFLRQISQQTVCITVLSRLLCCLLPQVYKVNMWPGRVLCV